METIYRAKESPEMIIGDDVYQRYLVKTLHINSGDDFSAAVRDESHEFVQDGDVIMLAESVVAIAQGRIRKFDEVQVTPAARFFASLITPTAVGWGFSLPPTMQVVLEEVGLFRMSLAAIAGVITKPFGIKGVFYIVMGSKARAIDGPTKHAMPPANEYITLFPEKADLYAQDLKSQFDKDVDVVIVDANDVGVNIMGSTSQVASEVARALCADNPMGQGREGTPVLIGRKK